MISCICIYGEKTSGEVQEHLSQALIIFPLFLITKLPGGYKTEDAGWLRKKVQKNFTNTKRWKKSYWNSFHFLCPALCDVGIAWSSQGKFTRLQYLSRHLCIWALTSKATLQNKYLLREAYSCCLWGTLGLHFLLFTVTSRIKILWWSISPSLFSYFRISVLLFLKLERDIVQK